MDAVLPLLFSLRNLETVKKAFIKQEGISQDDMATAEDFGDYLLRTGQGERDFIPSICDGDSARYQGSVHCRMRESERAHFCVNLGGTARAVFRLLSHEIHGAGAFLHPCGPKAAKSTAARKFRQQIIYP